MATSWSGVRARLLVPLSAMTATATAAVLAVGVPAGHADPQLTLGQVQARIAALQQRAEQASEAYDAGQVQLAALQRSAATARQKLGRAQAQANALRAQISATAVAAYQGGGLDELVSLMTTPDPQSFLDRSATLDSVARYEGGALQQLAVAEHEQRQASSDLAARTKAQQAQMRALSAAKQRVLGLLAQQQSLLSRLRAADRARLAAQQAQSQAAALAVQPTYHGPVSGLAAIAVRAAYAQLGKPYQWGAAGPDSFDCSGLTMYAWAQAGVSLPHYTGAQYAAGRPIPESALQPGDLVFFYSDMHHVGIYIGGGQFIHAPHTGTVVQIASLAGYYQSNYAGAVRVVG